MAAPAGTHGPLVLLLTGDGNWARFDRQVGEEAVRRGSPVLGVLSRSWLRVPRTPDETADALAEAVRAHLKQWGRTELVVVGYSRGAEMAPFVIDRWPPDLRARVRALALVAPAEDASFTFHWIDMLLSVHRSGDLPVRPELAALAGLPTVCVRGAKERDSLCDAPPPGMRVLTHAGGHRVADDGETARSLLSALGL
jgi:type IV secretory pathway VirJ component